MTIAMMIMIMIMRMTAIMGMVMMATPNEQFLQRAVTQTTITKKGMIMMKESRHSLIIHQTIRCI